MYSSSAPFELPLLPHLQLLLMTNVKQFGGALCLLIVVKRSCGYHVASHFPLRMSFKFPEILCCSNLRFLFFIERIGFSK